MEAYQLRAECLFFLKDYDGALQDAERVLAFSPNCADAYHIRARSLHGKGDPQALADFQRAIDLEPERALFFHTRGRVRSEQEDWLGALEDFNRAGIKIATPKPAIPYRLPLAVPLSNRYSAR